MSQSIQKVILHNILLQKRAEILHLFVFMVVLAAILNLTSRGDQRSRPFCLRWILKTKCPYLTPCQIKKNLSPSARLFQILGYSSPAMRNLRKKIEISTFTGDPKRKALTKVQFNVLEKHFLLFIFHLGIKNIFWHV